VSRLGTQQAFGVLVCCSAELSLSRRAAPGEQCLAAAESTHTFSSSSTCGISAGFLPARRVCCLLLGFASLSEFSNQQVLAAREAPHLLRRAAESSPPQPASAPASASSRKSSDGDRALPWHRRGACSEGLSVCLAACGTPVAPDKELPAALTDARGSAAPTHPPLEIRRGLSRDPEKLALSGPQQIPRF